MNEFTNGDVVLGSAEQVLDDGISHVARAKQQDFPVEQPVQKKRREGPA